jgi:hypothetical protein
VTVAPEELSAVVEQMTGSPDPGPWRAEKVYEPVASASAGIWRVSGDAWSVILKVVHHGRGGHRNWRSGEAQDHWYYWYWRREVLAYRSGLPDSFAGPLRGPRCHLISERPDGAVALWLEDAGTGGAGTRWPVEAYEVPARHLGQAQGAFAVDRPLPHARWLSRDWLRAYLVQRDRDMELLTDGRAWSRPLTAHNLPATWADPLRRMRHDQDLFLDALDGLPRTVCHFDLHPANLFAVEGETVLIDWAFAGIGALGEDCAVLVADAVLDFYVRPERFDDLFAVVRRGYLDGLRRAGWTGPDEDVDLGMSATLAARYAWIAPALLRAVDAESPTLNRRAIDEAVVWWAPAVPFLVAHADIARSLIACAG